MSPTQNHPIQDDHFERNEPSDPYSSLTSVVGTLFTQLVTAPDPFSSYQCNCKLFAPSTSGMK